MRNIDEKTRSADCDKAYMTRYLAIFLKGKILGYFMKNMQDVFI